jgi:Cu/Ag efflux protein CusF
MRILSILALIIAFISIAFALINVEQLKETRESLKRAKIELVEVKNKFVELQKNQWPKFYDVKGTLLLKPGGNRLIIDHEEIPGVMPSMIMSYEVENPKQIEGLEPGDKVNFKLKETEDKLYIINIEKEKSRSGL